MSNNNTQITPPPSSKAIETNSENPLPSTQVREEENNIALLKRRNSTSQLRTTLSVSSGLGELCLTPNDKQSRASFTDNLKRSYLLTSTTSSPVIQGELRQLHSAIKTMTQQQEADRAQIRQLKEALSQAQLSNHNQRLSYHQQPGSWDYDSFQKQSSSNLTRQGRDVYDNYESDDNTMEGIQTPPPVYHNSKLVTGTQKRSYKMNTDPSTSTATTSKAEQTTQYVALLTKQLTDNHRLSQTTRDEIRLILVQTRLLTTTQDDNEDKIACFTKLKHLAALTTMGKKVAAHTTRSDQAEALGFTMPQVNNINNYYNNYSSGSRGHYGGPSRGRRGRGNTSRARPYRGAAPN